MILASFGRNKRTIAFIFLFLFYAEMVLAAAEQLKAGGNFICNNTAYPMHGASSPVAANAQADARGTANLPPLPYAIETLEDGGPSQPEMQQFTSVNSSDMVDLFTGDFSYNIPLLDVGGYPVNIAYQGGGSMDQEASWVGYGWNINPGTITRNLRGLPDDFNGTTDTITKSLSIKENKTTGATVGKGVEAVGIPVDFDLNVGAFYNNYKGWGIETGLNASIPAGSKGGGSLTAGLSLTNNSQDGFTIAPTLSAKYELERGKSMEGAGSVAIGSSYNSRAGLSGLQLSTGLSLYKTVGKTAEKQVRLPIRHQFSSSLSFAYPAFTPAITMPYTSTQFSFSTKVGETKWALFANTSISGYVSEQKVEESDKRLSLPAYGYLNYQNGNNNVESVLDFNREKDIPYREKPAIPHIAIPAYTYDVFSITGEGTGGAFRAYRGDIGYVRDNYMRTRDASERFSVEGGAGKLAHAGVDLNFNRSITQTGAWRDHPLATNTAFRSSSKLFEAAYFRNPGEKSINTKAFYEAIGGDEVVVPELYQSGSFISTTGKLNKYTNQHLTGSVDLNANNAVKAKRDKRSQVISYLTAEEADKVGLARYIESKPVNSFSLSGTCAVVGDPADQGKGTGFIGEYFANKNLAGNPPFTVNGETIDKNWGKGASPDASIPSDFSARWTGRLKAPVTGTYRFRTKSDDGVRLWVNDVLVIDDWNTHGADQFKEGTPLNLVEGEVNHIRLDFFDAGKYAIVNLQWQVPGQNWLTIPLDAVFNKPLNDTFSVKDAQGREVLSKEKRINSFRKKTHISEIDVLNPDGRRYVYGIPVYNIQQKEATFSLNQSDGDAVNGTANFTPGVDNTVNNQKGNEHYFSSEEVPSYAHSFLLTGILSPDYADLTGDGISEDDQGDAIKFNYTKTAGIKNALQWRVPFEAGKVTYNEGLRTDNRDDKGNYIYGSREHWYLNSIESKNMVAAFFLDNTPRLDAMEMNEAAVKTASAKIKRLRKIVLYNKAEFLAKDTAATPVKTVYFEYSYELCPGFNKPLNDSGKLTLKKIWFSYNGNEKGRKNAYVFTYHSNNPAYNIRSYDRWGNYKSPAGNPTTGALIPNSDYPYVVQDSAMAASNVGAWALTQIKLPSGGIIKVDYESDDYAYVQNKRAMQLFKLAGLSRNANWNESAAGLYTASFAAAPSDNLYVYIDVSQAVTSEAEIRSRYLDGIDKLYFRLYVSMPGDKWGSGYEYVPCYADIDHAAGYSFSGNRIRLKLKGINKDGTPGGEYSPLAKAAIQFLRLNLPSKAFTGSEVGDDLGLAEAVRVIYSMYANVMELMASFDNLARVRGWARNIDLNRSLVRLACPTYKRLGGGARVKRITVYDSWYKMTRQKEATYGQEYNYTDVKEVDGQKIEISSGVAAYEPGVGSEENPFHLPVEYTQRVSVLAPVTIGYTEEPLGESFFPSPSVGYSRVRVRSIHTDKKRSANGVQESCFYTAYDYPTKVEWSVIDDNSKKRYKPTLPALLKIDAKHYLTVAQGFKVELNDMHGKLKSTATYAENDMEHYVTYTGNFYKTENPANTHKQLNNTVMAVNSDGTIDPEAVIGKDIELMMDSRQQQTLVYGNNVNLNVDLVPGPGAPPVIPLPSLPSIPQREETLFRSLASVKVIQRYGLIDSIVQIDKGSKVTARNLVYDSETGEVVLSSTQNEFQDPVYQFSYPSRWAYDALGLAYANIGVTLENLTITNGKITAGLNPGEEMNYLAGGDELMVYTRQKTGGADCSPEVATFPGQLKAWVVDSSLYGGAHSLYLVDADGRTVTGHNLALKVIRSGRKNIDGSVGSVSMLVNPVEKNGNVYTLRIDSTRNIINAAAVEYKGLWRVPAAKKHEWVKAPVMNENTCGCLKPFFDYLIASQRLLVKEADNVTVRTLVNEAIAAGYPVDPNSCMILRSNLDGKFYEDSSLFWSGNMVRIGRYGTFVYKANIGSCSVGLKVAEYFFEEYLNHLTSTACNSAGNVQYTLEHYEPECNNYLLTITNTLPYSPHVILVVRSFPSCNNTPGTGLNLTYFTPKDTAIMFCSHPNLSTAAGQVFWRDTLTGFDEQYSNWTLTNLTQQGTGVCPPVQDYRIPNLTLEVINCEGYRDTLVAGQCYDPITDSATNPYLYGITGNMRTSKAYTYYGDRTGVLSATGNHIRKDGTIPSFIPFWIFNDNKIVPRYDLSRWVWNAETSLYGRRGLELETKDPLGRFNSGIYGYNHSLPVAVIQNGRYRESAFEGFEDYFYSNAACNSNCVVGRHFDFSDFKSQLSDTYSHTGKYSLKINAGTNVAIAATVKPADDNSFVLNFNTKTASCTGGAVLDGIKTNQQAVLPVFSPLNASQVLISAWVREEQDCKCSTYVNNQLQVTVKRPGGDVTTVARPAGNIIEGWQRYEVVIAVPADATSAVFSFMSTGSTPLYVDDIRIHPYHANMKSFIYHPVNLRLMAELDENNYAAFYEYDDDGTLIRVKKETERGVKTIQETRSALRIEE
ncbi:PA14 domain-containing protein [Filimonas effusa]|uniref:PA14 domain-containing protein n=1 Tax=Filimonas effusa TaxID=2508721 RepID=A0A4Q1D9U1_9BACT|nr:PA14 domain-containing protein [Filimonas effusa]RXK86144.1 hypothetical protein ESB13_04860 [Filimonas effusa]